MIYFNNFNEMFNDNRNTNMSVFNYQRNGDELRGDSEYSRVSVDFGNFDVRDEGLFFANNGYQSFPGEYTNLNRFADNIESKINTFLSKYGLKYKSRVGNSIRFHFSRGFSPCDIYGEQKGREILGKLKEKLMAIVGEAVNEEDNLQQQEKLQKQREKQRINDEKASKWNPEWDADFEDTQKENININDWSVTLTSDSPTITTDKPLFY